MYEERWASETVGPLCVYLHGVHDPGNVGAILRSADAFGASCVACGPGTADPFSPKAVRASMGAIFSVPVARTADPTAPGALPGTTIALAASTGIELWRFTSDRPRSGAKGRGDVTLLVGAERDGLPEDVIAAANHTAHIPIQTHSLNAAMAATVALYELTRMATRTP